MRSFYFRPGQNVLVASVSAVSAMYMANSWWHGEGGVLMFAGMTLFGAAAIKGGLNAMSSEPALKFDGDKLSVRTTFSGIQEVPWRQVQQISVEVYTVRQWGFVPVARTENIVIACEGGLLGTRWLRLSASAIQLPGGGAAELVNILKQAHIAAVGVAGVAMAGAGSHGWGVAPVRTEPEIRGGFEPDTAIARYLASKETGEPAQAPATPQSVTQKPAVPQRPVFGRRVS